jgi:hypothetical protein
LGKAYVLRNRLDFSDTNTSASDVVQALAIPAMTYVLDVVTRVVTAEGGTLTATVGEVGAANAWDNSVDLNASADTITQSVNGTDAHSAANARGYVYTTAKTIDLTMSANAADTAVLDIFAICFDLNI